MRRSFTHELFSIKRWIALRFGLPATSWGNLPMCGDTIAVSQIALLLEHFNIRTFIETGTFLGATTLAFANKVDQVHTIESNALYFHEAKRTLEPVTNVRQWLGNSPDVFKALLPTISGPTLFFLDAHWNAYCPLLDELTLIANHKQIRPVIVIHDFLVPNRPFTNHVNLQACFTWEGIRGVIERIYGAQGYFYFYNQETDPQSKASVGIVYIVPRQTLRR